MEFIKVRNWNKYQHYQDDSRSVVWIKLYIKMLDDPLANALPENAQSHLFKLFLLAGRKGNKLPKSAEALGYLIEAQTHVDIELLSHWFEPWKEEAAADAISNDSIPSNTSTSSSLNVKGKSAEKGKPEKPDPLLHDRKQWAVDAWNKVASDRGWPKVSKIPSGEVGDLLTARVKDSWWVDNYPKALEVVWGLQWPDKPKSGKKGLRFVALLRGDSVRAIIDGEWADAEKPEGERREGGSWEVDEDEAEKILAGVLK